MGCRLRPAPVIREVWWSPPRPGWTKLIPTARRLVCVFRTCRGFIRGCFTSSPPILHALEAELGTMINALELAQSNYWSPLWIETDSVYLVELVRNRSRDVFWRFHAAWTRSLEFLESIIFHVSQANSEGNKLADCLTSHETSLDNFTWWFSTPAFCTLFANRDIAQIPTYHFS